MSERLDYLARRVGEERFFLASAFSVYARGNGLDDVALAQFLGCPSAILVSLRLCRRPDGTAPTFRADVARIADHFAIDGANLAQIIRWADAVAGLRAAAAADTEGAERGVLLAARDREAEGTDPADDEEGGRS